MAISNSLVGAGLDTVFSSNGTTALTFMSLCNTSDTATTVSIYIVPSADVPLPQHLVVTELLISAKDTFEVYHAAEKIILDNGDKIVIESDQPGAIAAFVSYTGL